MKKYIMGFLLGAIVFSGIGVVAYSITSNDVSYDNTTSNLEATNLQDAVDELTEKASNSKTLYGSFIASSNGGGSATSTPVSIDVGFEYTILHVWVINSNGGGYHNLYIYDENTNYEFTQTSGNATVSRTDTTFSFKNSSWYNGCTIYYLAVK